MSSADGQRTEADRGQSPIRGSAAFEPEVTLLKWSSSLMSRDPRKFALGLAATVVGLAAVWWGFGGQLGAVILAALLFGGALGPLYLPTHFTLTDRKAYQQTFISRDGYRWKDFDEYRLFNDGVYLHLRPTDLRMRYLKGLTVFFGRDNREAVLDIVRGHVSAPEAETRGQTSVPGRKN